MTGTLRIADSMVAVRLIHEDGYNNSGIDVPFFINEVYDPSVCRDAVVVAAPQSLESSMMHTSNTRMLPAGAKVLLKPRGRNKEWSYTTSTANEGLLEAGDRIRITATRSEDCFQVEGVSIIAWDSILWVEKPDSKIPVMNGVMVKRMERDSHIVMDSGRNYEPGMGIVACVGIPRSGNPTTLRRGDTIMFKHRKGAPSSHTWEGEQVEFIPFGLITGVLHEVAVEG